MNIIIVSPYSPKWSNIASVRWEKLAKYLSHNHNVTIVTSAFPEKFPERTFDVGKARLIEIPLKWYLRNPYMQNVLSENEISGVALKHKLKGEVRVILERILPFSSGGMLYHDFESYRKEIERLISQAEQSILITTYDPWFSLRLGSSFKYKYYSKIIWIADFRDPSFDVHESAISRLSLFKNGTKKILKYADMVTVVTQRMVDDYMNLGIANVVFIPNGFDGSLSLTDENIVKGVRSLEITYTGSLHPYTIELTPFLEALKKAILSNGSINFVFNYAGMHSIKVSSEFKKFELEQYLVNHGFLTRDEAIKLQRSSDVLLLVAYTGDNELVARSVRTGKVYEYLASGRPIIVIGPKDWEMREEVEADGISRVFHKSETHEIAEYLTGLASKKTLKINLDARKRVLQQYLYSNIAKKLEEKIHTVMGLKKTVE